MTEPAALPPPPPSNPNPAGPWIKGCLITVAVIGVLLLALFLLIVGICSR